MKAFVIKLIAASICINPVALSLIAPSTPAQTHIQKRTIEQLLEQVLQQTQQGKALQAIETYQQILTLARQQKDKKSEATALLGLGFNHDYIGQPQKALEYFSQALSISQERSAQIKQHSHI